MAIVLATKFLVTVLAFIDDKQKGVHNFNNKAPVSKLQRYLSQMIILTSLPLHQSMVYRTRCRRSNIPFFLQGAFAACTRDFAFAELWSTTASNGGGAATFIGSNGATSFGTATFDGLDPPIDETGGMPVSHSTSWIADTHHLRKTVFSNVTHCHHNLSK
jgi:hypothetical protein